MMDSPPVFRRGCFGTAKTGVVGMSLARITYQEVRYLPILIVVGENYNNYNISK